MFTFMATKTVTITEEAYNILKGKKRSTESFSEEIKRLLDKKGDILDLAGSWKMSEKEAAQIKRDIAKIRDTAQVREWS